MTTDDLLKQGIAALNEGRKTEAYNLLTEVVKHDDRNEIAWLWLSGAVNTDEDRRTCLENVLAINPNNRLAQRGLATLQEPGSPKSGHILNVTPLGEQARLQPVKEETATNEILQQAIAAIKSGEKERGRQLLVKALEQDEDNEAAWLWMSRCVDDRDVKRECFERVLAINPENKHAIEGLKHLEVLSKMGRSAMENRFSLSRHAASGAILASLIGTLWVLHYLVTTVYGLYGVASSLLDYVVGAEHNLDVFGSEALFVIVTRFLIAFGLSWAPITTLIAVIRAMTGAANRKRLLAAVGTMLFGFLLIFGGFIGFGKAAGLGDWWNNVWLLGGLGCVIVGLAALFTQ